MKWIQNPKKKPEPYWIDLIDEPEGGTDHHWLEAAVKWDGCIHLHLAGNDPYGKDYGDSNSGSKRSSNACDDYIHICNLKDFIERLIALHDAAVEAYKEMGEKWPGA